MGLHKSLEVPQIRGVGTIRVIGPDGEIKKEISGKNLLNARFWDGLITDQGQNQTYSSRSLFGIRTYIGNDKNIPNPYETNTVMIGEGTNHPSGVFSTGSEPVTDYPYIQIRNLYQVTGTARTIYSIGLFSHTGDPDNDILAAQDCVTRLLLPTPVVQGENDQIDLIYRLYFEEDVNSSTHAAYWAELVYWAIRQNQASNRGSYLHQYHGCVLGMGGVGYSQNKNSTSFPTYESASTNIAYGGHWLRSIESQNFNATNPSVVRSRSGSTAHYYWDSTFRTNKDYMYGELFNEWWPRDYQSNVTQPAWLGSGTGIQGNTIYQHSAYELAKFYKDETSSMGPFHNSFNFNSTSDSLVYDIDNLPQTTWRAVFGGTWPTTDRYPLFARMWWDESGAVDGSSAKYKLGFIRSLGTSNGRAADEIYRLRGQQLKGVVDDGNTEADRGFPGQTYWTLKTDLANGHHEYQDSRFGNLGFYNGSGITGRYSNYTIPPFSSDQYRYHRVVNTRKVVGLTTNTWWGWQSGKYGKSAHLGVEWRKLFPFERKVWQKNDISSNLSQIDWLEAINGLPGEVDDEMCVIVDKTSGVYLINASQDSVTQLTTLTGLDQCTVTRDPSNGNMIYTGIKFEENDITFYESSNNWQQTDLFHNNRSVGGSKTPSNSSTNTDWYSRSNNGTKIFFTAGYNWPDGVSTTYFKPVQDKFQRSSLYFDGVRDSLRVASNDTSQYDIDTNYWEIGSNDDFTFETWVSPSEFLNDQSYRLIIDYNELHINAQTNYGVKIGNNTLAAFYNSTDTVAWDHLAVVRESGTVTAYKNGNVHDVLSGSDTTALNPGNYIGMGGLRTTSATNQVLKGHLQQVRITKAARYSGAFTPEDFSDGDASDDQYFSDTLLSWTTEIQPLTISDAGDNYVDGCYSNLATTGSATGSGLTLQAYIDSNSLVKVAVEERGSNYRVGDKVTATIPTVNNPTAGEVLSLDQTSLVGGSGYVDGGYTVALSGGSGQNVEASITVTAGAVSAVVLSANAQGTGYAAGEQLFANDSDLGSSGNGAGFSIEIESVDEQATLTADPLEVTIDSVETRLEPWWTSYGHRTVLIRRHWRHPDLFVGIFQTGNNNYSYAIDINSEASFSYSGAIQNNSYGYVGEFFGDQGETGGITSKYLYDTDSYELQREIAWADWIQFEPNGLVARAVGLYMTSRITHWKQKRSWLIKTQRTQTSSRYLLVENCGADPWTAPHSILQIPNAENSTYPHYVIGKRYTEERGDYSRVTGNDPLIVKGGNRVTDDSLYESRNSVVSDMMNGEVHDYTSAGYWVGQIPTPGAAFAEITDSTGTGVYKESGYERYKGLALDGGTVHFCAPMWCGRDNADVATSSKSFPGAWPIDPENDEVIPHPLRWDIYGWDSSNSSWVKEEWGYNYTEHRWEVDTSTVKPGRPAPNGGGTHNLSGITESPYNNLTITFNNVRPEDTNNPIQGEWSGQYIYNGCVMDGITEFTFSTTVSNRPISIKTINQTIPSSGCIVIPEVYEDSFIHFFGQDHYFDLKIDGEDAPISFSGSYDETINDGAIEARSYYLKFSSNDIGKSLTGSYAVVNFASSETPSNWVWWTVGHSESVNATLTGLLGGNSYKNSATLISEGWTMETESNTRVQISASNYPNEFPDGFAYLRQPSPHLTDGHYAETILIARDNIGFFWHDGASALSYSRQYISDNSTTNNPKYGGMQWMYDDSHELTCVHSKTYSDANGDNWLVIRASWTYNTSELTDPRVIAELWISVDDPFTYEVRFGEWTSGLFDLYSSYKYLGIAHTNAYSNPSPNTRLQFSFPHRKPYGATGTNTYTSNIKNYNPWGGDPKDDYPNHKYEINLDPHDYNEPN